MWGFVNSLQLISYLPLLNISTPNNVFYVLSLINGPTQFKLVDTATFTANQFGLTLIGNDSRPAYNTLFTNFGLTNNLSLDNLDNVFYYLIIVPITSILILLLRLAGVR